jgi:peptidoglycan/LPS O-acetylase OafA/YrhL
LLVHAFFPSPEFFLTVNVPSWTLSCELLFYLLFPLIVRPVRRIPQNRLWTWAGVLVVGMALVPVVGYLLLPDQPSYQGSPASVAQFWFGYFFPVPRLFEFVLGMVLARIVLSGRWLPLGIAPAAGLMLLGYAAVQVVPFLFKFTVATILPIGALICAAAAADHRGAPSVLRGRVMRWLGEVSFGLYICQGIVLFYGRWLLGPERVFDVPEATAVIAGLFLANLLAGWMLYVGVERPIMRRWSHPRRGTVVAPARKATAVGSAPEAAGAVATMAAPTGPSAAPPAELPTVSVVEPR